MTTADAQNWAKQQRIARSLMNDLQDADRDENDAEVTRLTTKLEAMGYTVEWTSAGIMVTS